MTPKELYEALLHEIVARNLKLEHANPQSIWPVFRAYSEKILDDAGVIVGFEFLQHSLTGKEKLHLLMVIQFELHIDDEYDHMEQVQCRFEADPVKLMAGKRTNMDSDDYRNSSEYYFAVESDENFSTMGKISEWTFKCIHTGV